MKPIASLQPPTRNESVVGAHVYSNSGEFAPQVFDLELPCRGVSFQFSRTYRSGRHEEIGPLGRGWTYTYAKRIEEDGQDILLHDGFGKVHRFTSSGGAFISPDGLYASLTAEKDRFVLRQRHGHMFVFDAPHSQGRLRTIEDKNGNALRFSYRDTRVVATDAFGRQTQMIFDGHRLVEVRDHTDRNYQYIYDANHCLVEVILPAIHGIPTYPQVRYTYDHNYRLASIIDPKGQPFLRNTYDDRGRITHQEHGEGAFDFMYEDASRIKLKLKNGGWLHLTHDHLGHVVERTWYVSSAALPIEARNAQHNGLVPITTTSLFNRHGEVVRRTYPGGNSTEWVYDEDSEDPRSRGDLLRVTEIAASSAGDPVRLVTLFTYESTYQQIASVTDPRGHKTMFEYDLRGNLSRKIYPTVTVHEVATDAKQRRAQHSQPIDRFEYNDVGQLIRFIDPRGDHIDYFYYQDPLRPINSSTQGVTQTQGGYLSTIARYPRHANREYADHSATLTTSFDYDDFGNVTTIRDGKGNATRLEYDDHNHVTRVTSRPPFNYTVSFAYDLNGNMIEGRLSFEHEEYDPVTQVGVRKSTEISERFEYNRLNNVVIRTVAAGDKGKATRYFRDAAENVVRELLPGGTMVEYGYDERNLVLVRRNRGVTTSDIEVRHTYTPNGRLGSTTNGRGDLTVFHYDGFNRYQGSTTPGGTVKTQWRDEAGNVTRVQVAGDMVDIDEAGGRAVRHAETLLESRFDYDELNRLVRMDRVWRDPVAEGSLGRSQYDGTEGVISSVVQYGENLLPAKLWTETGNVLHIEYDGAGRVTTVHDDTGETVSLKYDENSNPIRIERLGPRSAQDSQSFRQLVTFQFDEMDRCVARSMNDEQRETFLYNALGALLEYRNPAGASARSLYDVFGRFAGRVTRAVAAASGAGKETMQTILERVEWDDNDRVSARIDARGRVTRYHYDTLNRLSAVVFSDGSIKRFDRDPTGNIVSVVHPNGTRIMNRFDESNRLIERRASAAQGHSDETFDYDGLNRLVAASANGVTTARRYDSLSRIQAETQSGRTIRYGYDSAGNRQWIRYPGGDELRVSHDRLGRISDVQRADRRIVHYEYGCATQFTHQRLGEVLDSAYSYEPGTEQLKTVTYRAVKGNALVEETTFRYDSVGNCIQQGRLRDGENVADHYFYDSANRLVRVQYGVERLGESGGGFEREVTYELDATGTPTRETTHDRHGDIVKDIYCTVNERGRYSHYGHRRFEYDSNGNRVRETNVTTQSQRRFAYDYNNRVVRVEDVDADNRILRTIEYAYDTFGRGALKRVTEGASVREFRRVWNGAHLIEEWEGDWRIKSFVYGARLNEPVSMTLYSEVEQEEYIYILDGRGSVAALIDGNARVVEGYHYDVLGEPLLNSESDSSVDSSLRASAIGNVLFTGAQPFDGDLSLVAMKSGFYDPTSFQTLGECGGMSVYGPWTPNPPVSRIPSQGEEGAIGGYTAVVDDAPMSMPVPKDDNPVQMSDLEYWTWVAHNLVAYGLYNYFVGRVAAPLKGVEESGTLGKYFVKGVKWGAGTGLRKLIEALGSGSSPADGGSSGGSQGSQGDTSQGSSQSTWHPPYAAPEDRPFGAGVDYGHPGGGGGGGDTSSSSTTGGGQTSGDTSGSGTSGSGTSGSGTSGSGTSGSGTGSGHKEHKPVLGNDGQWVWEDTGEPLTEDEKRAQGADKGGQTNPIDGTGEGIEKDWWRDLPYADPLRMAEALRSPLKFDERERTPYLSLGSYQGMGYLIGSLTSQPVKVDERGETLTLNLQGVQSASLSAGISTSDGWGDKPRSLAEAYALPRIRDAKTSRF